MFEFLSVLFIKFIALWVYLRMIIWYTIYFINFVLTMLDITDINFVLKMLDDTVSNEKN